MIECRVGSVATESDWTTDTREGNRMSVARGSGGEDRRARFSRKRLRQQ